MVKTPEVPKDQEVLLAITQGTIEQRIDAVIANLDFIKANRHLISIAQHVVEEYSEGEIDAYTNEINRGLKEKARTARDALKTEEE